MKEGFVRRESLVLGFALAFCLLICIGLALPVGKAHALDAGQSANEAVAEPSAANASNAENKDSSASDTASGATADGAASAGQPGDVAGNDSAGGSDSADAADTDANGTSEGADTTAADKQDTQEPAAPAGNAANADDIQVSAPTYVNMFRLYNPYTGEHFYTSSEQEAMDVAAAGWQWEGIGWVAPDVSSDPVYRLYNPFVGDHHYTLSKAERDKLVKEGWIDEGIGWYSDGTNQLPIFREYNPNAVMGSHNFTASKAENDYLVGLGWTDEGTAWYAAKGVTVPFAARWLVAPCFGTMQRYWIDNTGSIVKSRYIDAAVDGSGWNAYAKPDGAVVCGKWDDGAGHVYVADSKGELAQTADGKTGWLVTSNYDNCLQRYYYDATQHAMQSGFFTVGGNNYLGMPNEGYVLRGKTGWAGHVLLANNDGVMATGTGWLVTDVYDGRLERYWLEPVSGNFVGAKTWYFGADGNTYYGLDNVGYVLRNDYLQDGPSWYHADNDGVLTVCAPPEQYLMTALAQGIWSDTDMLIMVNLSTAMLGVYTGSQGNWTCIAYWLCSPGKPSTPTITGDYEILYKLAHLPSYSNALYASCFEPSGYFIHSILGDGDELGDYRWLSHGCVRLDYANAAWIKDNAPIGTRIHIYY